LAPLPLIAIEMVLHVSNQCTRHTSGSSSRCASSTKLPTVYTLHGPVAVVSPFFWCSGRNLCSPLLCNWHRPLRARPRAPKRYLMALSLKGWPKSRMRWNHAVGFGFWRRQAAQP